MPDGETVRLRINKQVVDDAYSDLVAAYGEAYVNGLSPGALITMARALDRKNAGRTRQEPSEAEVTD